MTEMNNEQNVFCNEDTRDIIIRYDKLLGREDVADKNIYTINRRSYYKILPLIANDINYVISRHEKLIYDMLSIRIRIYGEKESYTELDFYNDLEDIVNDKDLLGIIEEYIDSSYTLNLNCVERRNVNEELQLTDDVNKILLKSSVMMRLLIPILCDYKYHDKKDIIFLNIFKKCIKVFSNDTENALNKLYKIIYSRIFQTKYSDVVIWKYLKNLTSDPQLFTTRVFKSIIKSILPKLENNKSCISFLDVVIRQKLHFEFTYNHPMSFKAIKVTSSDSDDLDEREKMEINSNLLKGDEGILMINRCSIFQEIKEIKKTFNVSHDDIELFKTKTKINSIHFKLLELYYSDKFSIVCDNEEMIYLTLGMYNDLILKGFSLIPKILLSKIDERERRINSRRKLIEKVISSQKYKNVLKKYIPIRNIMDKNNAILSLTTIKNNKFIYDGEELVIEMEILNEELLDLLFLI